MTPEDFARFRAFVHQCASTPTLLEEFDRLNHTNLCGRGTPMQLMVDQATGRLAADVAKFMLFCLDLWERRPQEAKP